MEHAFGSRTILLVLLLVALAVPLFALPRDACIQCLPAGGFRDCLFCDYTELLHQNIYGMTLSCTIVAVVYIGENLVRFTFLRDEVSPLGQLSSHYPETFSINSSRAMGLRGEGD